MEIYKSDTEDDEQKCPQTLIDNLLRYIYKQKFNPLYKLLYLKGSERGTRNLQDKFKTIISNYKKKKKKYL